MTRILGSTLARKVGHSTSIGYFLISRYDASVNVGERQRRAKELLKIPQAKKPNIINNASMFYSNRIVHDVAVKPPVVCFGTIREECIRA